jgi:hypothetical protein
MYTVRNNIITLHKQRKRLDYHIKIAKAIVEEDDLGTTIIHLKDKKLKMSFNEAKTIEDYEVLINWIKNAN